MTKRWHAVIAIALVASQLSALSVSAAPPTETERQSRRFYEKAEAHFRAGVFAEALSEYQAGYDLVPLPGFLINIAQCQRRLGDLNQALITYRKFIMVAPDSRFAPDVKKLTEELQTLVQDAEKSSATAAGTAAADENVLEPPATRAGSEEASRTDLVSAPNLPPPQQAKTRWWLWGTVAATVVVGVTVAGLALRDPGTTTVSSGSLGTLRR
jgi:tetratricopeptide (TPR) repeat protein